MSDLLERLQRHARTSILEPSEQDVKIEQLRAEIARLQAAVDAARAECDRAGTVANRMATPDAAAATLVLADRILRALDGEVKP